MSETVKHPIRAALSVLPVLLCAFSTFSQGMRKMEKAGDAAFAVRDYYTASRMYAAVLYDSPLTVTGKHIVYPFLPAGRGKSDKLPEAKRNEVVFKLAESYRLYNHPKEAVNEYEKYFASGEAKQNPSAQVWYGYALLADGQPAKAMSAFENYLAKNRGRDANAVKAREGMASAAFAIKSQQGKPAAQLKRLQAGRQQDGSDFGLEKINDSIYWFTTSRHELDNKGARVYPIRLYAGNLGDSTGTRRVIVPGELNVATPSLSADGLTMYFTGWKASSGKQQATPYHIYYMHRAAIDSPWKVPIELPATVNAKGYQSKQPYVTRDGRYLFFSSDQPGGAGGFDIWMVSLAGRDPAGKAVRLDSVNTSGDEVTPFFDAATGKLFFSSDGRVGMGGLDIYSADGQPSVNHWSNLTNLGWPLNSVRDDQYYRKDYSSQTAYLSSDRASSCCLELFKAVHVNYVDTPRVNTSVAKSVTPAPAPITPTNDSVDAATLRKKQMLDSINAITLERAYIHYDYASAGIRKVDRPQLDMIVLQLKENSALNIVVASFTDCNGTPAGNERVARARSAAVKAYLVARGINASRINTDFFSRRHFVLPCLADKSFNKDAQLANRRSDLILTKEPYPKWHPRGNEIDLDPAQQNPLFRLANTNFDTRAAVVSAQPAVAKGIPARVQAVKDGADIVSGENSSIHTTSGRAGSAEKKHTAGKNKPPVSSPASGTSSRYGVNNARKSQVAYSAAKTNLPGNRKQEQYVTDTRSTAAATPPPRLDINNMLDFTPRVKSGVVEEMTKRIPRQPLYVYSTADSVRVDLYDNGVFDSDSVSVIFNKRLVVYQQVLETNKPVSFYVKLSTDPARNEMIFFAENLGLTPPNSALMVITDSDNRRTEVNVTSDLEHNTVIYFIKLKK